MRFRKFHSILLGLVLLLHLGSSSLYDYVDGLIWPPRVAVSRLLRKISPLARVLVVTLEERDLQAVPDIWPWNRRLLADLLEKFRRGGAASVGIALDLQLDRLRKRDPEQDQVFRQALEETPCPIYLGTSPSGELARRMEVPVEEFSRALEGYGQIILEQNLADQVTRLRLIDEHGDRSGLEALQKLLGAGGNQPAADRLEAALDPEGQLLLPFHLLPEVQTVPLGRVLQEGLAEGFMKDRVVLLGASAVVLHELYDTPVKSSVPAVVALGMVLEGALRDQLLWELPDSLGALWMVATMLLVVWAARKTPPLRMTGGLVAAGMLWYSLSLAIQGRWGLVLPVTRPLGMAFLLLLLEILRQRSEVRSEFLVTDPLVEREARRVLDRAMDLMTKGCYDEALKEFAEVVVMETVLRSRAEHRLVLALLAMDRLVEAEVLVGSLDFDKLGEEEIYLLARELEVRGSKKEARRVFEKLYLIDPEFQDVKGRLAELRHELSGFSEDELAETIARRILDRRFVEAHLFNKGGGGFLFRVIDRHRPDQAVALKILSPLQMNSPLVVRRFLGEARLLADLRHPNLIRILDVFEASLPYYTMEFLEGESVMERLRAVGQLAPADAVSITVQASRGLGHAHANGVVHRDVKPHNLLVTPAGEVTVIDFGIAGTLDQEEALATGQLSGTPLYMSPEQARGEPTGAASDLYSLGLVLHEMLYGGLPFGTMQARLGKPAPRPPPSEEIPEALVEVLLRCLAEAPEDRFASMEELEKALFDALTPDSSGDS